MGEGLFFSECFSLESLCLAENNLTSVPFFLDKMTSLKFLDLSHNLLAHGWQQEQKEVDASSTTLADRTPRTWQTATNADGQPYGDGYQQVFGRDT